ncbi:AAA family ATPase [Flavobacterium branchiicola]|uniref:AAA family ATPase n=1 Tax=Flavobacterium branchiicola TaxID=1114875 RepID=A0ABV9PCF8_9FLAO|nr:AAA family ATPase [Flavobacterium branchiicola]MBS7253350.1 AAA family ATPase [Flavobacterium branchiicola]
MIKLNRAVAPDLFLSSRFAEAKAELQENFHKNNRQERVRFDDKFNREIKKYLMYTFHEKCVYCETKLGVSDSGILDSFRPKSGARGLDKAKYAPSHYWWLYHEWDNMMLSCSTCGVKYKRDFFPLEDENLRARTGAKGAELLNERALLIDPCQEDPEEHLSFSQDGAVNALTPKGQVTIEVLGLNRQPLQEKRKNAAQELVFKLNLLKSKRFDYKLTLSLVGYVNDLYSGEGIEYIAVQKAAFGRWYEENGHKWKVLKAKVENNSSQVTRSIIQKTASDQQLAEISETFNEFKRFSIKSFTIINFKSIKELTIDILPNGTKNEELQREAWLLILGDNGIGKSSILQALSLALCGRKQLLKLDLDVADFLRRGESSGSVTIQSYESDNQIKLSLSANGFDCNIDVPPTYIMSYGSTRLLPKKGIVPDSEKEPFTNVRNLFDYTVSLEDPNLWLGNLAEDEFLNRVVPAFYDVLALKGDDKLYRKDGTINISHYKNENELEDSSDGYKTIVALVSDIMQTLSSDLAGYHNTNGIVFIDEIGNHLHPRWRARIAGALRNAFPNLQFIVTSHEPLCLRGLSHGEVVVMVRDKKHQVQCLDKTMLPDHSLMSVEQLLTSDLFGLIDGMDSDAEKSFEEYYDLLSKRSDNISDDDQAKIEILRTELNTKGLLGNNLREQVLFEAIDSTIAKKMREEGFKAKEIIKDETVAYVKNLIQNDYKDLL